MKLFARLTPCVLTQTVCLRLKDARLKRFNGTLKTAGFTLVEVMVALAIMAIIAVLSSQAFNTASSGAAATREALERMAAIDQTFVLMENDFRNALPKVVKSLDGDPLPPFRVANIDDYWLMLIRGGASNDLMQLRSETVRIGYRQVDDEIWRDTWYNLSETDQEKARQRKLVDKVKDIIVRLLPNGASSVVAGPWLDAWPNQGALDLPLAIEITVTFEDIGEVKRLFMLLPGLPPNGVVPSGNRQANPNGNNNQSSSAPQNNNENAEGEN